MLPASVSVNVLAVVWTSLYVGCFVNSSRWRYKQSSWHLLILRHATLHCLIYISFRNSAYCHVHVILLCDILLPYISRQIQREVCFERVFFDGFFLWNSSRCALDRLVLICLFPSDTADLLCSTMRYYPICATCFDIVIKSSLGTDIKCNMFCLFSVIFHACAWW
jgi:hypothetical protein